MNRLSAFLKVRPTEGRLVILVALLFACIQAGQGLGDNAASALFLLRFGVDFLPYMYIFLGGIALITTLAYSAGLNRFRRDRYFLTLIVGLVVVLLVERIALELAFPVLYPLLWLTISCIGMILGTLIWNVAGEVCDARQAKRLFPLFASAGILGSVFGNLITGSAARLFGTPNLLLLYAVLLGMVYLLLRAIARGFFTPARKTGKSLSLLQDLRAGFDFVRTSTLLRLIALASVLFSILFFSIAFPFNKIVTASFAEEQQVAAFFGLFNSLTTAATFLASLLIANRVFARVGIVNGVLLMPLTYLLGFTVFASQYNLTGAVIARFAQLVILSGIASTAWNALFNVVPSQKRSQVLAFNNGVPSQIGVALSGVLLILGEQVLSTTQIFIMGMLVTLVCGFLIWRMRAAYGQALVDALRLGRVEVFNSSEPAFAGLQGDAAALQVAMRSLRDPRPTTRRLAAEILGKMPAAQSIPALMDQIGDPDASVRASVISALGQLGARPALSLLLDHLDDPDTTVRARALRALAHVEPETTPELLGKLENLLMDQAAEVRLQAAVLLGLLGGAERAAPTLLGWFASNDPRWRIAALETISQAPPYWHMALENGVYPGALQDASAAVRRAACQAIFRVDHPGVTAALLARLADPDASVRDAAAGVLRQHTEETRPAILELLESETVVEAALDALAPADPQDLTPLRLYARKEIDRARYLRACLAGLPSASRAVALLRRWLEDQAAHSERRLIKTVGLLSNPQTMELVGKNMHGGNSESRSAALEALETLGDKQLAKGIVSLLEEVPAPLHPSTILERHLDSDDRWSRVLAARAVPELSLHEFEPRLRALLSDPDNLLREAASDAISQIGEDTPMQTMQTITTIERILLLREIPIFAGLAPEDLEQIAGIAREQWYPPGAVICAQGDEGDSMFLIVSGDVQVTTGPHGNEQVIAERGAGDFVGEMAIIDPSPRSASLSTKSEVRVLAIEGETFKAILRERSEVALAVLQSLSRRLKETMVTP